jgi:hypothetical protein
MSSLLTIPQIASSLPPRRGSRGVANSTIIRWIVAGVPGPDGMRVKLRATRAGGRWLVRQDYLDQFFAALNPQTDTNPPRATSERRKSSEAAGARLDAVGA